MTHFMKRFFVFTLLLMGFTFTNISHAADTINGAGATFPYPVYSQWAYQYNQITGVKMNYQSIGSGGGIAQIKAKTVDFGASDAPLNKEDLDQAGLVQFPMIIGGVVPVVNIPGVASGKLHLTGEVVADLFLGNITKWNDAKIKALNPDLNLPDKDVTVVHRADGSGTSWIFTTYLSKISNDWKTKVGANNAVSWPAGVGGKGNEGVAAYVQRVEGSIGYVEYAFAVQNKMAFAVLKNSAGQFVAPSIESFQSAAANAAWEQAPGFAMVLVDQPGEKSWPITGASFILMYKNQQDSARAKTVLKFFDWAYKHGTETATKLDYVPMPNNVVNLVQSKWQSIQTNNTTLWP